MQIDINTIQELLVTLAWLTPIVIAVVQVTKGPFKIPSDWAPLYAAVLGILAGILVVGFTLTGGFAGLVIGLTASGAYDLGKKTGGAIAKG